MPRQDSEGSELHFNLIHQMPSLAAWATFLLALIAGVGWALDNVDFVVVAVTASLSVIMTVVLWRFTRHLQRADDLRIKALTLQQSEAHANLIIDTAPNAMLVLDQTGHIQRVNTRMQQLFGYTRLEMLDQPLDMLIPERFRATHDGHMQGFFARPVARFMGEGRDLFARRKDGEELAVEIGLAPLETSHGRQVLASIVDISGRLRAQAQIEAALQEKTLLLNEIHHRVKNNLQIVASLLSLQAGRVGDPKFSALIAESESRVRAMALMHQVLYERKDFARVELDVYLQRLAGLLGQIHGIGAMGVIVKLDVQHITMDLTRAIPLGLIVNELLCNAFKHAFPDGQGGEVRVELQGSDASEARLLVRDNGKGLSAGQPSLRSDTLGMQIVNLLTEQIGGSLKESSDSGTCYELRFTPFSANEEDS